MTLKGESKSSEADSLIYEILTTLKQVMRWSYKAGRTKQRAAAAILHELLRLLSLGGNNWLYRSLHLPSFTGHYIGYKPFKSMCDALKTHGMIEVRAGYYQRDDNGLGAGEATRLRPTQSFVAFAARYGITPDNYRQHFRPTATAVASPSDLIKVRAAKKGDWLNRIKGGLIPIDSTNPQVTPLIQQIERLNAFFADQHIEGCTVDSFYRLFNQGDDQAFAFNKGGRLYADGNYQRIEREARSGIRINGEPVVEVDVAGSHLTLLHTMLGKPWHTAADPYAVAGVDNRDVVKSFIVMTLGNGKFQTRWSLPIAKKYEEDHGVRLQEAYPLAATREAILRHLPVLALLPDSGISWADLQYRESLGLIAAVETLAFKHGVPALPLHDSVIVPASKRELAAAVMKEAFQRHTGTTIRVTIK